MKDQTSTLTHNQKRILAALSQAPMSKTDLMARLKLTESPVLSNLRKLKAKGLVYVAGSRPNHATKSSPLYGVHVHHASPLEDQHKARIGKTAHRRDAITAAIQENGEPMTAAEIASWLQIDQSLVNSAITHYRQGGRCTDVFRIWSWVYVDKPRCGWTPQYGFGPGRDATKPPVDKRKYMAIWRERNRAKIRAAEAARRLAENGKASAAENPFWQLLTTVGVQDHSVKRKAHRAPEVESA